MAVSGSSLKWYVLVAAVERMNIPSNRWRKLEILHPNNIKRERKSAFLFPIPTFLTLWFGLNRIEKSQRHEFGGETGVF